MASARQPDPTLGARTCCGQAVAGTVSVLRNQGKAGNDPFVGVPIPSPRVKKRAKIIKNLTSVRSGILPIFYHKVNGAGFLSFGASFFAIHFGAIDWSNKNVYFVS